MTSAELAALKRRDDTRLVRAPGELLAVFVPGKVTNPLNGSHGHWTKHRRWAKDWRERAQTALLEGRSWFLTVGQTVGPAEVPKAITFIAYVAREFDDDNIRAACKPCRDALKDMRVIDDDKPSAGHVFEYQQVVNGKRDARRGIEIRVRLRGEA